MNGMGQMNMKIAKKKMCFRMVEKVAISGQGSMSKISKKFSIASLKEIIRVINYYQQLIIN